MKKRVRLRNPRDFQRVMSLPRLVAGRTLIAFARPRADGPSRVGVTTSRRLRPAVRRNRARRRLREVARQVVLGDGSPLLEQGIPFDVVLIGRAGADAVPFADLVADARRVVAALAAKVAS